MVEEALVETHLHCQRHRDPVDEGLGLRFQRLNRVANHLEVVNLPGGRVADHLLQLNGVASVAQANDLLWRQSAKVAVGGVLLKVLPLNEDLLLQGDHVLGRVGRIRGKVGNLNVRGRDLVGHVGDQHSNRREDGHGARSGHVEDVAHRGLQHGRVDHRRGHGQAHQRAEVVDGEGGEASAAQGGQREEARVVPVVDDALADQLGDLSLRHDGVVHIEATVLPLHRAVHVQ